MSSGDQPQNSEVVMGRIVPWVVAVGMVVVGAVWTFQGLGYLEGSFMTGEPFWAIAGPVVAGLGLALMLVLRDRGRGRR